MRKLYILALTLLSAGAYGQIQQDINKNGGTTESNPINDVDSIRFNSGSTEMEVILNNGSMESHTISDIDNVTFSGSLVGIITNLDCNNANLIGTLEEGSAAAGVSIDVDYTGGNGGTYTGQAITSTGVTGLTAQLSGGNFANGAGTLTYAISGTPASAGTATFSLNIGGQTCNLDVTVDAATPTYPPGYVHCGTATAIVEVTNPTTNEVWMDRNLGATQVATSSTDTDAYGDLFQWGRFADGHQCRNSTAITTTSSTDDPGHGDFIRNWGAPYDWRIPQNDNLWQGVNGVNNPCPSGYRLPTSPELNAERQSWNTNDEAGAFGSPLKLSLAGFRDNANGSINDEGVEAVYWSSTVNSTSAGLLLFGDAFPAQINSYRRARGYSVRCIKD